jgi:tetratricopeptide (TPR) repeat protein
MLDCQLHGLSPRGHHLTSLILHAANAILLFLVLRSATEAVWRSALVAALFALHPTRVESVAWVAERKDVLSAFFWLAALLAYTRAARSGAGRAPAHAPLVVIFFVLGLLSKPMVVTLPLTLLLFDYWPLARTRAHSLAALVREKWLLFALAAIAGVATLIVQSRSGAVASIETLGLGERSANAVVSYATYLRQLVWPAPLAVFYPYVHATRAFAALGAALLLLMLTLAAYRMRTRAPFVWSGWLWFLITLVPVIGIIQAGEQAHADRYTYVPYIGLFAIVAWGVSAFVEFVAPRASLAAGTPRALGAATAAAALVALSALGAATHAQARRWRTSETLFEHALRVTRENDVAHNNLGHALNDRGRYAEAVPHLREALRIRPDYPHAHTNLVRALFMLSEYDAAIAELDRWLAAHPDDATALSNLGLVRAWQGDRAEAVRVYHAAIAIDSTNVGARRGLGAVLVTGGDAAAAVTHLETAVRLDDTDAETRENLGDALFLLGDYDGAMEQYRNALRLRPNHAPFAAKLERARAEEARRAGLSQAR